MVQSKFLSIKWAICLPFGRLLLLLLLVLMLWNMLPFSFSHIEDALFQPGEKTNTNSNCCWKHNRRCKLNKRFSFFLAVIFYWLFASIFSEPAGFPPTELCLKNNWWLEFFWLFGEMRPLPWVVVIHVPVASNRWFLSLKKKKSDVKEKVCYKLVSVKWPVSAAFLSTSTELFRVCEHLNFLV